MSLLTSRQSLHVMAQNFEGYYAELEREFGIRDGASKDDAKRLREIAAKIPKESGDE